MKGPTERSLKHLRDAGYRADVVEKWIPQARKRKDLFGFIDIMCVGGGVTLAVQTTSYSNISARVKKMREETPEALQDVLDCGWKVAVHGWKKNPRSKRWEVKVVEITEVGDGVQA